MTSERCKERLIELRNLPGNDICADCGTKDPPPDFISLNLGLFVCINCSGMHRHIGTRYSVIKSIHLDTFDESKCEAMEVGGNIKGARKWMHSVPACWPYVTSNDYDSCSQLQLGKRFLDSLGDLTNYTLECAISFENPQLIMVSFDIHSVFASLPLDETICVNLLSLAVNDLLEQWIRAKYERQEFKEGSEDKQVYVRGAKYGYLFKKEKSSKSWNNRFFSLSSESGELSYYLKQEDQHPKHKVRVSQVNVMFLQESVTQRKHSMLISFPVTKGNATKSRFIYVCANTSFEIVDWFLSIRAARYKFLRPYLYEVEKPVVSQLLSRNFLKQGYLWKTGSKNGDNWLKRYICVDMTSFIYFEKALDPEPIGEVLIDNTCLVQEGTNGNHPTPPTQHVFMVHTQEQSKKRSNPIFNFCAESRDELEDWMDAFRAAIISLDWFEPMKDQSGRMSLLSNISVRCGSV